MPGDQRGGDPNWSPDGSQLVFGLQPAEEAPGAGTLALKVVDLRTHKITKIPGSEELWSPRWSRDGRHILAMPRDGMGLMLFDLKSQRWSSLGLPKMAVSFPEFSHHGDCIYFLGTPPESQEGIFRVRLSDHKLELVLGLENVRQATSSSWGPGLLRDVAWGAWKGLAPDDSPLLLRDAGTQEIYALDVDFP